MVHQCCRIPIDDGRSTTAVCISNNTHNNNPLQRHQTADYSIMRPILSTCKFSKSELEFTVNTAHN
jgi:hypothetical protein